MIQENSHMKGFYLNVCLGVRRFIFQLTLSGAKTKSRVNTTNIFVYTCTCVELHLFKIVEQVCKKRF